MSKQEKEMADAVRIFEALSGVDEELLVRSEEKVRPIWYYGKVLAACLCFVVMGALLWNVGTMQKTSMNFSGSTDTAPAMAVEEAACENETALEGYLAGSGTDDGALKDVITESRLEDAGEEKKGAAVSETTGAEKKKTIVSATSGAIVANGQRELTLKEAGAVAVLGEYIPTAIPTGYVFESAWLTENSMTQETEQISLCWTKGMDDIHITVSFAVADVETVDVSQTETYDVYQYAIPYASTVPEEYRTTFHNPVFAEADFTQEIVEMRMKVVEEAGDTDTPGGNFAVLYESGVLVEFNGNGDAESVYALMDSVW